MRARILLNPTAETTGTVPASAPDLLSQIRSALAAQATPATVAAAATPAPAPAPTAEAPAATPAPTAEANPATELHRFLLDLQNQAIAADRKAKEDREARDKEALKTSLLGQVPGEGAEALKAALGKFEALFTGKIDAKDSALKEVEARLHKTLLSHAVSESLSGVKFVSASAQKQAVRELEGRFEVSADGSGVREKGTGKGVAEVVRALLPTEDFLHFVAPESRGKGGTGSGDTPAPSGTPAGQPSDVVGNIKAAIAAQRAGFAQTHGVGAAVKSVW